MFGSINSQCSPHVRVTKNTNAPKRSYKLICTIFKDDIMKSIRILRATFPKLLLGFPEGVLNKLVIFLFQNKVIK